MSMSYTRQQYIRRMKIAVQEQHWLRALGETRMHYEGGTISQQAYFAIRAWIFAQAQAS